MIKSTHRTLGVFAKQPAPGRVKTRLAEATSPEWAAKLANALLADTLDRLANIDARRVLAFTPADAASFFSKLGQARFELMPQSEGDLGQRMLRYFEQQFATGASHVVLVGSDSPHLPREWITQAFTDLERHELVLGPTCDGGYYLVGMNRLIVEVFEGVAWSEPTVLGETIARLPATVSLGLLPLGYDIDTVSDCQCLRGQITALRRAGVDPQIPHTEALLTQYEPDA